MANQIAIDPRFFANAVRDYSNPVWAFVREIMQNAMDSEGCSKIQVDVQPAAGSQGAIDIRVVDNGAGMNRTTLETKLLALGGTGKAFAGGKVGGFGKAKELLFFAQRSYRIRTQQWELFGVGGNYDIVDRHPVLRAGCEIHVIWMYGSSVESFVATFQQFTRLGAWPGKVYVNGALCGDRVLQGSLRRSTDYANLYVTKSLANTLVVRVSGIPMFESPTGHKLGVIAELKEGSRFLAANRDELVYPYREQLTSFVTELTVDSRSALRKNETTYERFGVGKPVRISLPKKPAPLPLSTEEQPTEFAIKSAAATMVATGVVLGSPIQVLSDTTDKRQDSECSFVLKNNTDMKIPKSYYPASFGSYPKRLLRMWVERLTMVHTLLSREDEFSVGFIFDNEAEAEHEFSEKHGRTYYVNPAVIHEKVKRRCFNPRFSRTDGNRLMAIAVHEVVHGMGFKLHNEAYANKLTDVMGVVLGARRGSKLTNTASKVNAKATIHVISRNHKYKGRRLLLFELLTEGMTIVEYRAAVLEAGLRGASRALARGVAHGLILIKEPENANG